jgi:predicted DNA-binding protein
MSEDRQPVSFRLTPETARILDALAKRTGLSKAGVIALSLRESAERRGIEVQDEPEGKLAV